jgi:uncharacterized protein YcbK (DUF882 family)
MLFGLLPLHVVAFAAAAAAPAVEVTLYDANHRESHVVSIARDGSVDDATRAEIEHALRCRRTGKTRRIDQRLLAMIADVAIHYPGKTIEYVSGYRGHRGESRTSPHRAARAFDFRIRDVSLIEVRDYLWARFSASDTGVGVGWYPGDGFVHLDHRPGQPDTAWTEVRGRNRYKPSWSRRTKHGVGRTRERRAGI